MKKIYKHFLKLKNKKYFFYFIISIIIILLIIINNSFFQTKGVKYILFKINKKYNTNILIDNISINLIVGNIKIKKIQVLDKKNNILIFIPKIEGNINIFNLFLGKINIKNLRIYNSKINILTYKNDHLNNLIYFIKCFKKTKYTNNKINNFSIINFYIKNAYIHIIDNNKYINLIFKGKCNFFSKKILFYNENIKSYISNIIVKGQYNKKYINFYFYNKKFLFTNNKFIINNNKLIFNNSKVLTCFSFYYKKYEDLLTFYKNVFFSAIIERGSYISSNDINLFINNKILLKKSIFYIKCKIYGIFNKKINILNFDIKSGKNIIQSKHIILYQLNQEKYFCCFFKKNTIIKTSFFDIKKIFSIFFLKKIPLLLNNYGKVKYYGSININYKYIHFNGYFISNRIGCISGNLVLCNFQQLKNIKYQGKLYINIYNLYPLLENNNYKHINAEFIFYGQGYELKNNNFYLKGIINNIFIYNRKINNIKINGYINNNFFYGKIYVNDNNINIKFNGKIKIFAYKYFLSGAITFNYLNNIFYKNLNKIIFIPKLYLEYKYLKQNKKILNISIPKMINLSFFGKFKWIKLYNLLINNINKLINNEKYNSVASNQFLYFKINITDKLINILNEQKSHSYACAIIGNLSDKNLTIYGKSKIIKNTFFIIKDFNILLNTNKKYNTLIHIDTFSYKRMKIKNINIYTYINNNILLIKFYFFLKLYNLNQEINLNFFKKYYYLNGIKYILIGLSRSLIKMNNNNWWINENNNNNYSIFKINLNKKIFIINNLFFYLKNKKINITSKFINNNYNIIQGCINNIKYKNFFNKKSLFINCNISKGLFTIEKYNPIFTFEVKLKINNIYMNNTYIGNIHLNIIYNKKYRNYKIFLGIENKKKYILSALGYIKNFLQVKEYLNLKIKFHYFPIVFFKKFIKNSFDDIRGTCTGIINIIGDHNNFNYKGYLYLKNIGIKINNINTDYEFINNTLILFINKTIIIKNLIIRDTKYNSIGYVNGLLIHEGDKLTVSIYIDSKNILLIDNNQINNKIIYGIIFTKGKIHLLGDINNISINVNNTKITNSSKLIITKDHNATNIYNLIKINFLKKNNYKKLSILK